MLKQNSNNKLQKDVTVSTVDGFQGGERDIILISCVRAKNSDNAQAQIGFLNDARCLNVAITRAKQTLIVLGHAATLESRASDIKELIKNLKKRSRFFTEQQLNQLLGNEANVTKAKGQNGNNGNESSAATATEASLVAAASESK